MTSPSPSRSTLRTCSTFPCTVHGYLCGATSVNVGQERWERTQELERMRVLEAWSAHGDER